MQVLNETRTAVTTALMLLILCASPSLADENPFSAHSKSLYDGVQKILLAAAEKMPEASYNFKPTEEVRSYGQIVGHIADTQYFFCSTALGEKNPGPKTEQTKTTKAEIIAALKEALAYCDKVHASMTDASGAQLVKSMGGERPRLGVLTINQVHSIEHYGNLVTYMRLKGIVPPTSDPAFMKAMNSK
jgi:uncharacterized damage-inducible protein DinB